MKWSMCGVWAFCVTNYAQVTLLLNPKEADNRLIKKF